MDQACLGMSVVINVGVVIAQHRHQVDGSDGRGLGRILAARISSDLAEFIHTNNSPTFQRRRGPGT